MAAKIQSGEMHRYRLNAEEKLWTYCCLDCAVDHEIASIQMRQLDPKDTKITYEFTRKLLGPFHTMMKRGFRIDHEQVKRTLWGDESAVYDLSEIGPDRKYKNSAEAKRETRNRKAGIVGRCIKLGGMVKDDKRKTGKWQVVSEDSLFQSLAIAISGKTVNYHSPKQLQELLYGALALPPVTKVEKGKVKKLTNRTALESLATNYPRARIFTNMILTLRGLEKLAEVLEKNIDEDGRMRCSFNPVGTETGRPSSSESVWQTGMNLQNVTAELRSIFIPDPGKIMFNADLEQAESRAVAYISEDKGYINACESDDLHTTVASMLFGIANDRSVADGKLYYRHFTYRDMAKRAGHALNYGLSPRSLAMNMKISVKAAWRMYLLYLGGEMIAKEAAALGLYDMEHERDGNYMVFTGAFPGIRNWHNNVRNNLEVYKQMTTARHRKRMFWGRPTDGGTFRAALAYEPQSLIAEALNEGMYQIWANLEPELELFSQVYDSVAGQMPEKKIDHYAPLMLECLKVPMEINGRTLTIPAEIKVGYNLRDMKKWG